LTQPPTEAPGDAFWPSAGQSGSDLGTEAAGLATLAASVALARSGDFLSARRLSATVVFHAQPLLGSRPALLRATMHALLVARGFRLLSRVVIAITGKRVDVTLLPECTGAIEAPRRHDEARRIALLLDPRWLDQLSADDPFLAGWCDALTAREPGNIGYPGLSSGSRQLQPT
jgi:hypothetical protein